MEQYEVKNDSVWLDGTEIPVIWKGRVAVIGGGTAGVTAAASAARKKIPVIVIEKNSYFGGELSCGGGRPIEGAFPGDVSIGGMMDELLARLRFSEMESAALVRLGESGIVYYYDNEYYKKLADEILVKSGCGQMLNTMVIDVLASQGKIEGVVVSANMQKGVVLAEAFVDATGNSSVAQSLCLPILQDEEDGIYGYPYILKNVNVDELEKYRKTDPDFRHATENAARDGLKCANAEFLWQLQTGIYINAVYADTIRLNADTDERIKTNTMLEMRAHRAVFEQIQFYRSYIPGMEKCELYRSAQRVMALGGERIKGLCHVDKNERHQAVKSGEGIMRCRAFEGDKEPWYELPFGVMAPQTYGNLLVAGKGISVDRAIQMHMGAAARMAMGQCAGIAAAMIALQNKKNTEINSTYLRSMLDEVGCDIDGDKTAVLGDV